jgi:hypothetical protein
LSQVLQGVPGVRLKPTISQVGTGGVVRARIEASAAELDQVAERVFRCVADAGIDLRELKREDASLEDVFARLTTQEPDASSDKAGSHKPGDKQESAA